MTTLKIKVIKSILYRPMTCPDKKVKLNKIK